MRIVDRIRLLGRKPRRDLRLPLDGDYHEVRIPAQDGSAVRERWCEANLVHHYTVYSAPRKKREGAYDHHGALFYHYLFQDENDAFAFKMRWG